MKRVVFWLYSGILWLMALLPLWMLHIKARFLFFLIYYVLRYRRKITFENLQNSFPEKSLQERKKIARQYYQNLADLIVEFIKIKHISRKSINKHMFIKNPEVLSELYRQGKSVFIAIGHCGNWEWLGKKLALNAEHRLFAVVKPLSDPYFNRYMNDLRVRFHAPNLIEFKKTYRTLLKNRESLNAVVIAADQTPTRSEINFWTTFLNQETPFFKGIEKMSKALDYAVLYFDIQRVRRGYYAIEIMPVCVEASKTEPNQITEKYVSLLEQSIRSRPDNWLWSHRRWKHKKETN